MPTAVPTYTMCLSDIDRLSKAVRLGRHRVTPFKFTRSSKAALGSAFNALIAEIDRLHKESKLPLGEARSTVLEAYDPLNDLPDW